MKFDELVRTQFSDGASLQRDGSAGWRFRDLEALLAIVRKLNSSLVLSDVLTLVVDEAIRLVNAERGALMLVGKDGKLEFAVARNSKGENIAEENFQFSSSVRADVFRTGESLCIESALNDSRFEHRQSIMNLALQTIICSPLQTQEEKLGVLYVDSKYIQAIRKAEILYGFEILAGHAAIAIKNARLYADIKQTIDDLNEANRHIIHYERMAMKGEIAAEVSHELKNLVSVVLLSLQRLQAKIGSISVEEINTIIEVTIAGVKKIENFSKGLLTHTRIAARPIMTNLNKIIGDFVETMRFLPRFKAATIRLSLEHKLPAALLDVDQMQQVLLNLMNNIVEARVDATIDIRTEFDAERREIRFIVRDNGSGIDERILQRIFVERVTTKREGHGFGLTVCRHVIEDHGGKISVESVKGEGATFIITLPVPAA
jgi:signal transduction histidine kinase